MNPFGNQAMVVTLTSSLPLPLRLALLGFVFLVGGRGAAGGVVIVDSQGGPGTHFTSLQQAVDAAADGDVLLVRWGNYDLWATIAGRGLTLVGESAHTSISGNLVVRGLAADQAFVMRDIEFRYPGGVEALDCEGPVILEDCEVKADLQGGSGPHGAVRARNAQLRLTRCIIEGAWYYLSAGALPTAGLHAVDSQVVITDSSVRGGGGPDTYGDPVAGAPGLDLSGSDVLVVNSTVSGGTGDTQAGGAGALVADEASLVLRASDLAGGSGVPAGSPARLGQTASLVALTDPAPELTTTALLREGETWTAVITGTPGHDAWLLAGLQAGWTPTPSGQGVLGVGGPLVLLSLGALPETGELTEQLVVPELGLDVAEVHVQAVTVSSQVTLGTASVTTVLDAGF